MAGVKPGDRAAGPPASSASPRRLGSYELVAVLGEGAMGTVYRARHPTLGADRALKTLRGKASATGSTIISLLATGSRR